MSTEPNYDINYDDQRFAQVESDKNAALSELEKTYSGMIGESDNYYQAQIDASKQWADTQGKLQQENTDHAINKIEQQKDQAQKDYTREQSGAYVDWQKQSNQYGANAEQMASNGMTGTGFSESSQVSMYNTYQNRVATAREAYARAVLNYDNAIKDAQLQNSAALAEIAYQALQQQLELSLQGFQYKNSLVLDQANKKLDIENQYYNRYQNVLAQINQEHALAEQIRQFNESQAYKEKQLTEEQRQFNYINKLGEFATTSGGGGGGGGGGGNDTPRLKKSNPDVVLDDSVPKVYSGEELARRVASGEYKETTNDKGQVVISKNENPYHSSDAYKNSQILAQANTLAKQQAAAKPSSTGTSTWKNIMNTINNAITTTNKINQLYK